MVTHWLALGALGFAFCCPGPPTADGHDADQVGSAQGPSEPKVASLKADEDRLSSRQAAYQELLRLHKALLGFSGEQPKSELVHGRYVAQMRRALLVLCKTDESPEAEQDGPTPRPAQTSAAPNAASADPSPAAPSDSLAEEIRRREELIDGTHRAPDPAAMQKRVSARLADASPQKRAEQCRHLRDVLAQFESSLAEDSAPKDRDRLLRQLGRALDEMAVQPQDGPADGAGEDSPDGVPPSDQER